jgi:hypothetical protein
MKPAPAKTHFLNIKVAAVYFCVVWEQSVFMGWELNAGKCVCKVWTLNTRQNNLRQLGSTRFPPTSIQLLHLDFLNISKGCLVLCD